MSYIFHTDTDPELLNRFVIDSDQNTLFQCSEWARIKEDTWKSIQTSVTEDGVIVASALVLIRSVIPGQRLCFHQRVPVQSKALLIMSDLVRSFC